MLMAGSQANAGWNHWRRLLCRPVCGLERLQLQLLRGLGSVRAWVLHAHLHGVLHTLLHRVLRSVLHAGCYSGYRGCGLLSRLAYRCRTHHYGYYWGCYSPSAADSACCSVCGYATVAAVAVAMESGIQYGDPVIVPDQQDGPTPAEPPAEDPNMDLPEKQTSFSRDSALLTVAVPGDARVLVNGIATRSTGSQRRYVSRNLTPGFDYTYEVRAEVMVDGKPVMQTKTVQLRAGQQAKLAFDMKAANPLETALTLHVPSERQGLSGRQRNARQRLGANVPHDQVGEGCRPGRTTWFVSWSTRTVSV